MTSIPLLEIIFAIFVMMMPEGTKSFSITMPYPDAPSLVWTLQEDGAWSGAASDGSAALGNWKLDGMTIIKQSAEAEESKVDISSWVTKDGSRFLVNKIPLKIEKTDNGAYRFGPTENVLPEAITIETRAIEQ